MRHRHPLLVHWMLIVMVLVGLTGCVASAASGGSVPSSSPSPTSVLPQGIPLPDVVQVVRRDPINPLPPFSRTVDNPAAAQQLYRAMYLLPPFTHGLSCPVDTGIDINFTFSHQGTPVLTARLRATGCRYLQFGSEPPQDYRGVPDDFITLLTTTLGVSPQMLTPSIT